MIGGGGAGRQRRRDECAAGRFDCPGRRRRHGGLYHDRNGLPAAALHVSVHLSGVYVRRGPPLVAALLGDLSGTPLAGYGPVNGLTALGMAVCCTLLGHNVFSWGLKYLPPAFIATVKLMEPVFASVWGLLLFGERPGWLTVAGGAAVLGVGLYARTIGGDAGKREEREP